MIVNDALTLRTSQIKQTKKKKNTIAAKSNSLVMLHPSFQIVSKSGENVAMTGKWCTEATESFINKFWQIS
jgi:hypothetical protein